MGSSKLHGASSCKSNWELHGEPPRVIHFGNYAELPVINELINYISSYIIPYIIFPIIFPQEDVRELNRKDANPLWAARSAAQMGFPYFSIDFPSVFLREYYREYYIGNYIGNYIIN